MRGFDRVVVRPALAAVLALALIGCGGSSTRYKVVPVTGTITFADGKPLPAGIRLLFNPAEGSVGAARAVADATGAFEVLHPSGVKGAELGKYTVLLAAPEGDNGAFFKTVRKDYYDGGVLTVEVKEGMGPVELKVKK